jgi:putative transcriptional regulator
MNHPDRSKPNRRRANPTVAEIRAARERAGLTQTEAARRIHSPSCAWKCWEFEGEENRPMHPGLFELFLIKTGQTDVPGRGQANDGDGFDESARFDEWLPRLRK